MCRSGEFIPCSVPDSNTLWSREEDNLLVQAVVKHSTSDVLGRDWSEVASEQKIQTRRILNDLFTIWGGSCC